MTINELYSRAGCKGEGSGTEALELDNVNNAVLLERLERVERRIFENKFITERFRALAREGGAVSTKTLNEIGAAMQAQTRGLNYLDMGRAADRC